ncbi:MAG: endonuclease V [Anaerosomatales bacterium]
MLRIREELRHPWAVPLDEAAAIQRRLATLVTLTPLSAEGPGAPQLAAGVDVGYSKDGTRAWAAAIVLDRRFSIVDSAVVAGIPDLAYSRGCLAFREGRLTLEALESLSSMPDLIFCDGHGVVHERGLGLASHIGVLLGVPTIGVPKTPFHAIDRLPERTRGSYYVLTKEWGAAGASIRLRANAKPVYVSPGHLVNLASAIALSLAWSTGRHRVPEPLQAADTASKVARNTS